MTGRLLEDLTLLVVDDNAPSRQLPRLLLSAGGASVEEAAAVLAATSRRYEQCSWISKCPAWTGLRRHVGSENRRPIWVWTARW